MGEEDNGDRVNILISVLTTIHMLCPHMLSYKISIQSNNLITSKVIVKVPAHCKHANLYSSP